MVAWKTAVFGSTALATKELRYRKSNQCALLISLRHAPTNQTVQVVGTHLKAKTEFETVRLEQVKELVDTLQSWQKSHPWDCLVICGDFNDEPSSPCYQYMKNQDIIPLQSCYARYPVVCEGAPHQEEAPYTTYKKRHPVNVTCRTIDYIWVESSTRVTSVLSLPWPLPETSFPSDIYPSDHVLLGATIALTSE